jgi:hypothetical protein
MPAVFGCGRCADDDPEAAHSYHRSGAVPSSDTLVEKPHFRISIARCAACGQEWVTVFTEDSWFHGGGDAMLTNSVPLTAAEAQLLRGQGRGVDFGRINGLGRDRRRLVWDWPADASPHTYWAVGGLDIREGR